MSPHYDDQMDLFNSGKFIEMKFGKSNLEKNKKYYLVLEPEQSIYHDLWLINLFIIYINLYTTTI